MKELSIEEKAKAYDEAIRKAKITLDCCNLASIITKHTIYDIFPELAESEGERIRKELLESFKYQQRESRTDKEWLNGIKLSEVVAWLEKQKFLTIDIKSMVDSYEQRLIKNGGVSNSPLVNMCVLAFQHGVENTLDELHLKQILANSCETCKDEPFDYENANIHQKDFAPKADMPRYSIGDVLCDKSCTMLNKESQSNFEITDIRNGMYICDKYSFPISQQDEYELVAKRIEQKPADNVEVKFKVGDFIVNDYCMGKIVEITNDAYLLDTEQGIPFSCHSTRLWDITKDAKDGDVLAAHECVVLFKEIDGLNIKCYCTYHYMGFNPSFYVDTLQNKTAFHPATKEQRDLLFQKMKESGYEWNAENKEVKKISQRIISAEAKEAMYDKPAWSEEDEEHYNACLNYFEEIKPDSVYYKDYLWLKSLKERIEKQ